MKLRKATIHNFRGILDAEFEFYNYTLLVGANNAGKSTVIDAIRAFYEKDGFKYKATVDFPDTKQQPADEESWAELEFELTKAEWDSLASDYKDESQSTLRLRKWFAAPPQGRSAGLIYARKPDNSLSASSFYGAKNVQSGKIGNIIYIPAISTVDEQTRLTGPSPLREILSGIIESVVSSSDAYGEFARAVQSFAGSLLAQRTADGRSLEGLKNELDELLRTWNSAFQLNVTVPGAQELLKSMIEWDINDNITQSERRIAQYGSGFQRYFIYSLILVASRYAVVEHSNESSKEFRPQLNLLLFEEPEAFLHPTQQTTLASHLRALGESTSWQVLCSTHSPYFVSRSAADVPAIIRVARRMSDGVVEGFQIERKVWTQLVDRNVAISNIAARYPELAAKIYDDGPASEMEALRYFLWLNGERSSAFFADVVLLVEGPTEAGIINRLIADGKVLRGGESVSAYVMDCIGKYNMHRFANLFSGLGIKHGVIFDDDKSLRYHQEVNELIRSSADRRWTVAVRSIPGNLETFLGIDTRGVPNNAKPLHALRVYEDGQVEEARIQALCEIVRECLGTGGD